MDPGSQRLRLNYAITRGKEPAQDVNMTMIPKDRVAGQLLSTIRDRQHVPDVIAIWVAGAFLEDDSPLSQFVQDDPEVIFYACTERVPPTTGTTAQRARYVIVQGQEPVIEGAKFHPVCLLKGRTAAQLLTIAKNQESRADLVAVWVSGGFLEDNSPLDDYIQRDPEGIFYLCTERVPPVIRSDPNAKPK